MAEPTLDLSLRGTLWLPNDEATLAKAFFISYGDGNYLYGHYVYANGRERRGRIRHDVLMRTYRPGPPSGAPIGETSS